MLSRPNREHIRNKGKGSQGHSWCWHKVQKLSTLMPTSGGAGKCRVRPVAIYPLLQKSAFGPEEIKRMEAAYEEALVVLKLKDRNDPLTETVAKFIVEAAQTGAKDPELICTLALSRMGGTAREAS